MSRLTILLLLLPLIGCMHRNYIHPDAPPETTARLNQEIAGHRGMAKLNSGESLWGTDFTVDADSSLWKNLHSGDFGVMPNRSIDYLVIQDRQRGIREGLIYGSSLGLPIGAFFGALVWLATPKTDTSCNDCPPSDSDKKPVWSAMAIGAAGGAAVGAGFGVMIGGGGGSLIRIDFMPETAQR